MVDWQRYLSRHDRLTSDKERSPHIQSFIQKSVNDLLQLRVQYRYPGLTAPAAQLISLLTIHSVRQKIAFTRALPQSPLSYPCLHAYRRIWSYTDRCQCGDPHDYTILGSTTRLSSQLAREILFDCTFALMFFRYFFHVWYSPTLILPTSNLATVCIRPDSTV